MTIAVLVAAASLTIQPYLGAWRLTAVVGSADMTSATDAQAQTLVGRTFSLRPTSAAFPGATCSPHPVRPTVTLTKVDPILKDDQVERSGLRLRGDRLDATALYIAEDCVTGFVTHKGRLIVPAFNGFVYSAERTRR